MIGAGVLEMAMGTYLLRGRNALLKLFAILWLSANFVVYRMANDLLHFYTCPCLGTLGDALHLSAKEAAFLLETLVLYLFLGSGFLLMSAWSKLNVGGHEATAVAVVRPSENGG